MSSYDIYYSQHRIIGVMFTLPWNLQPESTTTHLSKETSDEQKQTSTKTSAWEAIKRSLLTEAGLIPSSESDGKFKKQPSTTSSRFVTSSSNPNDESPWAHYYAYANSLGHSSSFGPLSNKAYSTIGIVSTKRQPQRQLNPKPQRPSSQLEARVSDVDHDNLDSFGFPTDNLEITPPKKRHSRRMSEHVIYRQNEEESSSNHKSQKDKQNSLSSNSYNSNLVENEEKSMSVQQRLLASMFRRQQVASVRRFSQSNRSSPSQIRYNARNAATEIDHQDWQEQQDQMRYSEVGGTSDRQHGSSYTGDWHNKPTQSRKSDNDSRLKRNYNNDGSPKSFKSRNHPTKSQFKPHIYAQSEYHQTTRFKPRHDITTIEEVDDGLNEWGLPKNLVATKYDDEPDPEEEEGHKAISIEDENEIEEEGLSILSGSRDHDFDNESFYEGDQFNEEPVYDDEYFDDNMSTYDEIAKSFRFDEIKKSIYSGSNFETTKKSKEKPKVAKKNQKTKLSYEDTKPDQQPDVPVKPKKLKKTSQYHNNSGSSNTTAVETFNFSSGLNRETSKPVSNSLNNKKDRPKPSQEFKNIQTLFYFTFLLNFPRLQRTYIQYLIILQYGSLKYKTRHTLKLLILLRACLNKLSREEKASSIENDTIKPSQTKTKDKTHSIYITNKTLGQDNDREIPFTDPDFYKNPHSSRPNSSISKPTSYQDSSSYKSNYKERYYTPSNRSISSKRSRKREKSSEPPEKQSFKQSSRANVRNDACESDSNSQTENSSLQATEHFKKQDRVVSGQGVFKGQYKLSPSRSSYESSRQKRTVPPTSDRRETRKESNTDISLSFTPPTPLNPNSKSPAGSSPNRLLERFKEGNVMKSQSGDQNFSPFGF